jgi:hypothetical protein
MINLQFPKLESTLNKKGDFFKRAFNYFLNRTEHYDAASLDELSAQKEVLIEDVEEDACGDGTPLGGYGTMLAKSAQALNFQRDRRVEKIEFTSDG